jgi:phthalate 4,5-cis-dihydrodiol dehydrogenase
MAERRLRLGVAGLGRAFALMLPALAGDPRIELVAAADPRREATERFAAEFGARGYDSVDALCADRDVEAVYVATPHEQHAAHVERAAARGLHVLVEKPMAITLDECRRMIDAAASAGVRLVVGHSHSFDRPIARAREIIASGAVGRVGMISAQYHTDFLYRPRQAEELDVGRGGGVLLNQGSHQVDIVRLLGGGRVRSVRAHIGAWDPVRRTEGAYAALLAFADGPFASLVYSGCAHFDGDELCGGMRELGGAKDPATYGSARRDLARTSNEAAAKRARGYGGRDWAPSAGMTPPSAHEHFGLVIACCERADLRPLPTGVMVYGDRDAWLEPLETPRVARVEVVDEFYDAVARGRLALHDGQWAMATLEVCLAMRQSAQEGRDIVLAHQTAVPA